MIQHDLPLLLGSASPRRLRILETLGIPVRVCPVSADETPIAEENADEYLVRVTEAKLVALRDTLGPEPVGALLVADTTVVLAGNILGKPTDDVHAREMIGALAGCTHEVRTRFAVAFGEAPHRLAHAETVVTRVEFRALSRDEIDRYVATGEGHDKAGGYAIQGIGAFAVRRIEGSYANVVGLPACEVIVALQGAGLLDRFPAPATTT